MEQPIICDTPEQINAYTMLVVKGCLKQEMQGMKRRGRSVCSMVKAQYGFKGGIREVYNQYVDMLVKQGILR